MTTDTKKKPFDPDTLSNLPNLILKVESIISYLINSGVHRSIYHGSSIEFAEHKIYTEGDETRKIDWKLFGKTDRYYIKQFENEANLNAYLVIDGSASMGYKGIKGDEISKLEYASILLASIAYILIQQQDKVGLLSFLNGKTDLLPCGWKNEHLNIIIQNLENIIPQKEASLIDAVTLLTEHVQKKGIVFIISDLLDRETDMLNALNLLKHRKQDIVLIHLFHHSEITFPFEGDVELIDIEEGIKDNISVNAGSVRDDYLKELTSYIEWWRRESAVNGFDYYLVDTGIPVYKALTKILSSEKGNRCHS